MIETIVIALLSLMVGIVYIALDGVKKRLTIQEDRRESDRKYLLEVHDIVNNNFFVQNRRLDKNRNHSNEIVRAYNLLCQHLGVEYIGEEYVTSTEHVPAHIKVNKNETKSKKKTSEKKTTRKG